MNTRRNTQKFDLDQNHKLGSKYGQPRVSIWTKLLGSGRILTHGVRIRGLNAAIICSAAILTCSPASAVTEPGSGEPLLGPAISTTIAGRRIYLAVPLGGEFPLYYRKDGFVDGSGEAVGLGKFLTPNDSGKWWVDGNRLCQKWSQWYDGKTFCFTLEKLPDDKLIWRRDDGEEGIARIGP